MFDSRVSKYFSYGFSIILPYLDINKIPEPRDKFLIGDLKFNIHEINDKILIVQHDSNNEEKLKAN